MVILCPGDVGDGFSGFRTGSYSLSFYFGPLFLEQPWLTPEHPEPQGGFGASRITVSGGLGTEALGCVGIWPEVERSEHVNTI